MMAVLHGRRSRHVRRACSWVPGRVRTRLPCASPLYSARASRNAVTGLFSVRISRNPCQGQARVTRAVLILILRGPLIRAAFTQSSAGALCPLGDRCRPCSHARNAHALMSSMLTCPQRSCSHARSSIAPARESPPGDDSSKLHRGKLHRGCTVAAGYITCA